MAVLLCTRNYGVFRTQFSSTAIIRATLCTKSFKHNKLESALSLQPSTALFATKCPANNQEGILLQIKSSIKLLHRKSVTTCPTSTLLLDSRSYSRYNDYSSRQSKFSDISSKIEDDTLIYSYYDRKFYTRASIFTIVLTLLFGSQCVFTFYDASHLPVRDVDVPEEERTAIHKFQSFGRRNQWYLLSALYAFMGISTVAILTTYTRRSVRQLWLLKGGEQVRLNLYDFMGMYKNRVVPLDEINFLNTRSVKGSAVLFKVQGTKLQFMLDKRNGKFHETDLFDYVICMRRVLKNDRYFGN